MGYLIIGIFRAIYECFKLYIYFIVIAGFIISFFYFWALTFGVLPEFLELLGYKQNYYLK